MNDFREIGAQADLRINAFLDVIAKDPLRGRCQFHIDEAERPNVPARVHFAYFRRGDWKFFWKRNPSADWEPWNSAPIEVKLMILRHAPFILEQIHKTYTESLKEANDSIAAFDALGIAPVLQPENP